MSGGGGRWSTRSQGGSHAASRCRRRRRSNGVSQNLEQRRRRSIVRNTTPHSTLHGRWRPSRTSGPNGVNRALHRASNGLRCSARQVLTPGIRTRAPLARSIHPCWRTVCRSNELVLANDQVEATGVARMVTGALTDFSSALPARRSSTGTGRHIRPATRPGRKVERCLQHLFGEA